MENYLLSLMVFTPLVGVIIVLLLPERLANFYRWVNLGSATIQLLFAGYLYFNFNKVTIHYQWVEQRDWIMLTLGKLGKLSIEYHMGVDGVSILMVLLSGIVLTIGALASWNVTQKRKGYFLLYMVLASNVMGCFVALDFFLFYLFFEFMLLPMYFLIGLWGGKRSSYASIKFFLYTLFGSVLILIVMIGLYLSAVDSVKTGKEIGLVPLGKNLKTDARAQVMLQRQIVKPENIVRTFNLTHLADDKNYIPNSLLSTREDAGYGTNSLRYWAFILLFIGFAIKLPIIPLHTWLPDAHVEAPTGISVVLAGILLKIGGYGLVRFAYTIFPEGAHHFGYFIAIIGVLTIIYGGLNAMAQKDLKRLIAYSSVSHMGFVLLGLASLTAEGMTGAVMMMFSHGFTSAASFIVAGVLYDRTKDRLIDNYSGLASKMPYYTALTVGVFFASLGLPGFSGFVAELFTFLGAFASSSTNGIVPLWLAILSLLGLLITAAYYLWVLQRMFFGKYYIREVSLESRMTDLSKREGIMLTALVVLSVIFGLLPSLATDLTSNSLNNVLKHIVEQGTTNLDFINPG